MTTPALFQPRELESILAQLPDRNSSLWRLCDWLLVCQQTALAAGCLAVSDAQWQYVEFLTQSLRKALREAGREGMLTGGD
jgi:hypothetical protein